MGLDTFQAKKFQQTIHRVSHFQICKYLILCYIQPTFQAIITDNKFCISQQKIVIHKAITSSRLQQIENNITTKECQHQVMKKRKEPTELKKQTKANSKK